MDNNILIALVDSMKSQVSTIVLASALLVLMLTVSIQGIEAKTFTLDDFSFNIPSGCKPDKEKNRFQTDTIHLECGVSGGVHKEMAFESGTFDELVDMNAAPEAMISEVESAQHTIYSEDYPETFESGADKYTVNNFTAPYVISKWEHTGYNLFGGQLKKDIVGMAVAVKIGEDKVVLAQYLAAQDAFDKNLKKFESTFQSIKPVEGASSNSDSSPRSAEDTAEAYQKCLDTDGTTLEFCQGKYPKSAEEADAKLSPEDLATRQKAQDLADKLRALAGQ